MQVARVACDFDARRSGGAGTLVDQVDALLIRLLELRLGDVDSRSVRAPLVALEILAARVGG